MDKKDKGMLWIVMLTIFMSLPITIILTNSLDVFLIIRNILFVISFILEFYLIVCCLCYHALSDLFYNILYVSTFIAVLVTNIYTLIIF